jgi:hypothetical protein
MFVYSASSRIYRLNETPGISSVPQIDQGDVSGFSAFSAHRHPWIELRQKIGDSGHLQIDQIAHHTRVGCAISYYRTVIMSAKWAKGKEPEYITEKLLIE